MNLLTQLFGINKSRRDSQFVNISEAKLDSNAKTIYFTNGMMYKVSPSDEDGWYDARYLVSDGILYDLENIKSIQSINVPTFENMSVFDGYGTTGSLDYVIRMKAGCLYNRNEKELCSACLWKSTELMFENQYYVWRKKDYERLIKWHLQLGMNDEAEKAKKYLADRGLFISNNYNVKINKNATSKTSSAKKK